MNTTATAPASPVEIGLHPELALVSLLQNTIEMTVRALAVAHPELSELDFPAWIPISAPTTLARFLVRQLDLLAELLPEYRIALIAEWHPRNRAADTNPKSDPF